MDVKFQIVPDTQVVNIAFSTTATVKNATAGASLKVTLRQAMGGTFSKSQTVKADASGGASVTFQVTIGAAGAAFFVAEVEDTTNGDFAIDKESATITAGPGGI